MVSLAPSHQSDQRRNRRLLLVSSCMEQYAVLQGASLPNVSVAVVNWHAHTLVDVLRAARKAAGEACSLESIALMVHGQAGVLDLTRSLKIDADTATTPPVARFWRDLAALVRPGGRIDLVSCSIASGVQGAQLLAAIRACTGGVQVAASCHVLSNSTTLVLETAGVDVKTTYFEPEALEQWTGTCMMFSAGADEDGDGGYKDVEGEKAKKKRLANRHWVRKLAKLQHTILENCFEAWQSEYLAERSNCYRATRYTEVLHQWQVDHEMARSMQAKMLEETKEQDSRMQVASDYLLMLAYTRQTQKRAFAMWVQEHRENKRRQHLLERIRYRWSSESRPPTAEEEEAWIAGTTLKPELPYEERLAQWVGQGVTRTFFRMVLRGWLSAARAEAKQRTASRLKTLEAQVAALLENQEKANAEERLMQLEQRTGSLHEHTDRLQEQLVGHQTQVQDRDSQEKLMRVTRMIQSKGWFRQSSLLRDILLNWHGFAFEQKRMVHLLDRTLFRMQTLQLQRAFSPWARKTREKLADKNQQVLSALHEGLQNTITTMDHLAGGEGGLSSMMDFKQAMLGESKVGRKDIEELSRKFKELDFMLEEQHKDQSAKWVAIRAKEEEAKRLKIERVCVKRMEQNNLQRQARCFDAWVYSAWESRRHQYQVKRFVARYQHRELADIFYTWCLHTQAVRRAAFRLEKGLERHYLAVLSLTFKAWSNNTKSKSNQQALVMRAALSGLAKNVDTLHFRVEQAADLDTMAKLNEEIIIQSELRESSEAQVKGVFKTMVEDRIAEENRKRNVTIERWTTRQLTRTELQAKAETFASWYDCARVSRVHEKRIKRMLQRIRNSLAARAFSAWVGHTQVAPVLLIVSSRMRQHHLLANSVHRDAAVVSYDWETTTLEDLVAEARAAIHPCARAQNISMMVTGKPGCVSVVKGRRTTEQSLNDVDVELFWTQLGDMVVKNGRIDLLASSTAGSPQGIKLVSKLEVVADRSIAAAVDASPLSGRIHVWQGDRLVMLSSRVHAQRALVDATLPRVIAVPYNFGNTELKEIVRWARRAIAPRPQVKSIAMMTHGKAGLFNIAEGCKTTRESLAGPESKATQQLQDFWREMAALVVDGGSIDIIVTAAAKDVKAANTPEESGKFELLRADVQALCCPEGTGKRVTASLSDAGTGVAPGTINEEQYSACHARLTEYFDDEELMDWHTAK